MHAETTGTVARVVRLLQYLAEGGDDVSIKEVAEGLRLPPSTVHRLLNLLADDGIVERSATRHIYRPGLELVRIASLIASKTRINEIALPCMRTVVEECDEVCMLVLYLPATLRVMVASYVDSSNPLRYQVERFTPHSLLWGATGRSTLAFCRRRSSTARSTRASRRRRRANGCRRARSSWPSSPPSASSGYALTQGQKIEGAVGIGAPIFNAEGNVLGSLCITIPKVRFEPSSEGVLAALLLKQVATLSAALGHASALGKVSA